MNGVLVQINQTALNTTFISHGISTLKGFGKSSVPRARVMENKWAGKKILQERNKDTKRSTGVESTGVCAHKSEFKAVFCF